MRTTISIDDDLLAAVKVEAARTHRSIGSVIEESVRAMVESRFRTDLAFPAVDVRPGPSSGATRAALEANDWRTPTGMQLTPPLEISDGRRESLLTQARDLPSRSSAEIDALLDELEGDF